MSDGNGVGDPDVVDTGTCKISAENFSCLDQSDDPVLGSRARTPAGDFWALYNEWLRIRGTETTDPREMSANSDRADELARLIMVTPAPRQDYVILKFAI